jgi:predicted ATP-grasp superfamily ATP-dependent carboligase
LLLGGAANSLSIVRSLGRKGIAVRVSCNQDCLAPLSRYCRGSFPFPDGNSPLEYWGDLLLGSDRPALAGHMLLACCDNALEFLARHRQELERLYLLDDYVPDLVLDMLDKQRTLEWARSLGMAAPQFWMIENAQDLDALDGMASFPVIIKPVHSHLFRKYYPDRKYLGPAPLGDLREQAAGLLQRQLRFIVSELIPGPDSLLSSYYTYITKDGEALFHFTKRVLRRYPVNEGLATYHVTEWLPETAELGKRFFQGIGFRGLGNIEFKRDPRDGWLKVIESNVRFTQAHELLVRSGMDSAMIVYSHVAGLPLPDTSSYRQNASLLFIRDDILAFRQLHARGELGWLEWLGSIAHKQIFPYFSLSDPWPVIINFLSWLERKRKRLWMRIIQR